jgi:maltose alpha-D-glucosyltransferase / alpha-amylase
VAQASLIDELRAARWFGGKSRGIRSVAVVDRAHWTPESTLRLVDVVYADGGVETYVLAERLEDPAVGHGLLNQFAGAEVRTERGGRLVFEPTHLLPSIDQRRTEPMAQLRGEQSNTSIRFGDALILKVFRRVRFGPNPEVEIGWFLTEHTDFHGMPAVVGSLDYHAHDGTTASLALLQQFVANVGDAWQTTLHRLRGVLEGDDPEPTVDSLARLGVTTAALHVALARPGGGPDFDPEPVSNADLTTWRRLIQDELRAAALGLRRHGTPVDLEHLLEGANGIEALRATCKIRQHGDYHLGQVLESPEGGFVIIDFEGEPSKPLAIRREKRSSLRDVAGMLRSFDYARNAALRAQGGGDTARATRWYEAVRSAFLDSYVQTVRRRAPELLPMDIEPPLHALELEKAAYEVLYELNNRPDWLPIPLAALTS